MSFCASEISVKALDNSVLSIPMSSRFAEELSVLIPILVLLSDMSVLVVAIAVVLLAIGVVFVAMEACDADLQIKNGSRRIKYPRNGFKI